MKISPFTFARSICFLHEFKDPESQSCGIFQPLLYFIGLEVPKEKREKSKYDVSPMDSC